MILLAHIAIALFSLGYTTYLFFRPSKRKVYTSYGLVVLTLASGTYLLISTGSHLLEGCMMGLLYIAVALSGTLAANHKLAKEKLSA